MYDFVPFDKKIIKICTDQNFKQQFKQHWYDLVAFDKK